MFRALVLLLSLGGAPAPACDLALLLAVDVSGSVDPVEYGIQRDGLALALRDGIVGEALVRANARVALMQWTGSSRQRVTIPWTEIRDFGDVEALAARVAQDARIWRNYSTAIGDALTVAQPLLDEVAGCRRRVIDISGDGISNEGAPPQGPRDALAASGVTINAVVIETDDTDLTAYFWENVITGPGAFVVTASGFGEYPAKIRRKLIRETTKQLSTRQGDVPAPRGQRKNLLQTPARTCGSGLCPYAAGTPWGG